MIKFKNLIIIGVLGTFCLCTASTVMAKVTPEEAARLGKDLTPLGAEKAGNADGTIPAWDGGLTGPPANVPYKPGDFHPDPYKDDKPLFKITAQNMDQYADKLTEGHKEMMRKFPDFSIHVYPTHRNAAAPDWVYERTKRNATLIEMTDDNLGMINHGVTGGVPFPIPQSAEQIIFNHHLRWRGPGRVGLFKTANVFPDGSLVLAGNGRVWENYDWNDKDLDSANWDQLYYKLVIAYDYPARRKGEILLLRDPLNQSDNPRQAWQYLPGQRRIRRAPTVAFDTPNADVSGVENYDDAFLFNGSHERFDWKIVGKKEMYIPYNCYKADLVPEEEFLTPNFPNPEVVRFELHRVWVLEGTLKEGKRHNYSRRTLYFDEDTWIGVMSDSYDSRGNLWRTKYQTLKNNYDIPAIKQRVELGVDFTRPDYAATAQFNGLEKMPDYVGSPKDTYTPENLRRLGRR